MRRFNAFEKEIIKLISEIEFESNETFSRFLTNRYFTSKRKQALIVQHDTQDVVFYMSPEVFDNNSRRAKELKYFWSLISLIEYLIKQRYATNISIKERSGLDLMYEEFDGSTHYDGSKIILNAKGDYLLPSKPDIILDSSGKIKLKGILWKELYQNISDNLLGIISPSEDLLYLVKNKFQSEEDKRYHMQLKLTWLGIAISGCLGFYSISSDVIRTDDTKAFEKDLLKKSSLIEVEIKSFNNNVVEDIESINTETKKINQILNSFKPLKKHNTVQQIQH